MSYRNSLDDLSAEKPGEKDRLPVEYVVVGEMRPDNDVETCLRPLGLCELGGACESCWYRPDHPRFEK